MCRFIAYLGKPILMDEVIVKPKNSLINQSIRAHETEEPLNGDGFGVGWYTPEISPEPGLFVSVQPAWNDQNLLYLSSKIKTGCLFAHVRAASAGQVSRANCHPFHFKNLLFMHNGDIEGFSKIKRPLINELNDDFYQFITGQTDSEHLFALFMQYFGHRRSPHEPEEMAQCLELAIAEIARLKAKHHVHEPSYINAAITDGNIMVAIRYISDPTLLPPTLYYSEGAGYSCENGVCRMEKSQDEQAILIVSERLTAYRSDWHEIPVNHLLLVNKHLQTKLLPCTIAKP